MLKHITSISTAHEHSINENKGAYFTLHGAEILDPK
jgi:hypothetical protein